MEKQQARGSMPRTKISSVQRAVRALEVRLATLEAEAAIRRLVADQQWVSDAGSIGSRLPDWSDTSPDEGDGFGSRADYWVSGGGSWHGTGLSDQFQGYTHIEGLAARRAFAAGRPQWIPRMIHFLTNERIHVDSPTTASGRWYSWEAATVRVGNAYQAIWVAGRYDCEFVKEEDDWKIKSQHFQEVFSTPFESRGWTETAHVRFGPGQSSDARRAGTAGEKR